MHTEQAQLAELARRSCLFEPFANFGQDMLAHESPHRFLDQPLLVAEQASMPRQSSARVGTAVGMITLGGALRHSRDDLAGGGIHDVAGGAVEAVDEFAVKRDCGTLGPW
jgi:hypothetical protein